MLFSRRSETDNRAWAELRARIVQLLAENERLQSNARLEAGARAQLVETNRAVTLELCEQRIEYREVRRALDSLLADAFDGPHNPI
jgi:hypothetical protein